MKSTWETQKKSINCINVLINRAFRLIHYKKYYDSVRKFKAQKKINVLKVCNYIN